MQKATQLANRLREVILNGTWIANTNYKDQLTGMDWQLVTTKVGSLNTIALLTFHVNYYIGGILQVLQGGALTIRDKYSFDMPPIGSQDEWEQLLASFWRNVEQFAALVEQMADAQLDEAFTDEKYGSYQRNIDAMIEHSYYHLGQIVMLKKLLSAT